MPYTITIIDNSNRQTLEVDDFDDFVKQAPPNCKVVMLKGKPKKIGWFAASAFLSAAKEIGAPVETPSKNPPQTDTTPKPKSDDLPNPKFDEKSGDAPFSKQDRGSNPSLQPVPMPDFEKLGAVISTALSASISESQKASSEAWGTALKTAIDSSNERLKESLNILSEAYLELGQKVEAALQNGALEEVAEKRFGPLEKHLQESNRKALDELKSGKEELGVLQAKMEKAMRGLRNLASDIDEDSEDILRRIGKFEIGSAELLQQQVQKLREQLAKQEEETVRLRQKLLEFQTQQGAIDPEYVTKLAKAADQVPKLELDLKEKDQLLNRQELDLEALRGAESREFEAFTQHKKLRELESSDRDLGRAKEEFEERIDDLQHQLSRALNKNKELRNELIALRERGQDTVNAQRELDAATDRIERLLNDQRFITEERDSLRRELDHRLLELHQGEQHYREQTLSEHTRMLEEEFDRRWAEIEGETQRMEQRFERESEIRERYENESKRLQEEVQRLDADKRELQAQIGTGLPEAYQRAQDEIKRLREDEERSATLAVNCASLQKTKEILEKSIAGLREDESQIRVLTGELQSQIGQLQAEKQTLEKLKEAQVTERLRIQTDLEEDPIDGDFDLRTDSTEKDWLGRIQHGIKAAGFEIPNRLLYAFHTSLKCQDISPLTMLLGISGTGKSELPRLYSTLGGLHFHLAAVQPNWDSPSDLFGFYNYAEARPHLEPLSRHLLQFLPSISKDGTTTAKRDDEILLVLLDEMNLARVEYYFSDLLSRLESRRSLLNQTPELDTHLRGCIQLELGSLGKRNLYLKPNVLFVGTLNQDESTLDVSDKVIDRANAITFPRPNSFCGVSRKIDPAGTPTEWRLSYDTWSEWCRGGAEEQKDDDLQSKFQKINQSLAHVERGVAHRVFQAVQRYIATYPVFATKKPSEAREHALADQFAMKILPKLKGVPTETTDGRACIEGIRSVLPSILHDDFDRSRRGDFFEWHGCEKLFDQDA